MGRSTQEKLKINANGGSARRQLRVIPTPGGRQSGPVFALTG